MAKRLHAWQEDVLAILQQLPYPALIPFPSLLATPKCSGFGQLPLYQAEPQYHSELMNRLSRINSVPGRRDHQAIEAFENQK